MWEFCPYFYLPGWLSLWWGHRPNIPKYPGRKRMCSLKESIFVPASQVFPFESVKKTLSVSSIPHMMTSRTDDSHPIKLLSSPPAVSQWVVPPPTYSPAPEIQDTPFHCLLSLNFCVQNCWSAGFSWLTLHYPHATSLCHSVQFSRSIVSDS